MIRVVAVLALLLSGCATEHASKLSNMDKWQPNCANAAIERQLYMRNIMLLQNSDPEHNSVVREKIARLNELILESDRLCGPKGFYTYQS